MGKGTLDALREGTPVILDREGYQVGRHYDGYREIIWISGVTSSPGTRYHVKENEEVEVVGGIQTIMSPLTRYGIIELNGRGNGTEPEETNDIYIPYIPQKEQARLFDEVLIS